MTDQESTQYCRAALFPNKRRAQAAYSKASRLIDSFKGNLALFQFRVSHISVVAILGDTLPENQDAEIQEVLDTGTPFDLPDNIFRCLRELFDKESIPNVTMERRYHTARVLHL